MNYCVFSDDLCKYDYLRIEETTTGDRKALLCNSEDSEVPDPVLVNGQAKISLITDRSRSGKGFHLRYNIQQCGGTITEDMTEIHSPTQNEDYFHNLNCTWIIQAPAGKVVELK